MVEETKTKKEESKKDGGWGNIADMKAQKQASEDIDLSYLKTIQRANTIKKDDPDDELDGLLEEMDLPKQVKV